MNELSKSWLLDNLGLVIGGSGLAITLFVLSIITYRKTLGNDTATPIFIIAVSAIGLITWGAYIMSPVETEHASGVVREKSTESSGYKLVVDENKYEVKKEDWLSIDTGDTVELIAYKKAHTDYKTEIKSITLKEK